jgi:hypothetical protein
VSSASLQLASMQQYIEEGFSLFSRPSMVEMKGARTIATIELNGKGLNQAPDLAARWTTCCEVEMGMGDSEIEETTG